MSKRFEQGFSILEVLIAVVVIALGLLGIASLQAAAVSNTTATHAESVVATESYNLVARMRANKAFWKKELNDPATGITEITVKKVGSSVEITGADVGSEVDCNTAVCTPRQMARRDLREWAQGIAGNLEFYQAVIKIPASGFPKYLDVDIQWASRQNGFALNESQDLSSYQVKVVI